MLHGNVVDHLHHDNGLTTTSTAEQPHFTTTWERNKQVNNLNTGFKNINLCILLCKLRSFTMNGHCFG